MVAPTYELFEGLLMVGAVGAVESVVATTETDVAEVLLLPLVTVALVFPLVAMAICLYQSPLPSAVEVAA